MESERLLVKAVDHLNRYVSDVEKFIDFYQGALGYVLIDRGLKANGKNYAILKEHGHELFISEKEDFARERESNFRHIGYGVENADELLEALKIKGYVEKDREIIVKPFSRQFYLKDPDGFEVDLIQWTDKQGFYDQLKGKNE